MSRLDSWRRSARVGGAGASITALLYISGTLPQLCMTISIQLFFFQAEDGIRDADVTGVQTCALPILAPAVPEPDQLSKDLVAAATDIYGEHSSRRALHAKGIWGEATFAATDEAGSLCRATQFSGDAVPTLVRFSNGSGNPDSNDASREARGMAIKLRPAGGDETDMLATTARAFATRTPEEFLELLRLRKPDPETGQPDMEKLGAWLGEHPEAQPSIASTMGLEPPASFATVNYYSPHAFRYLDTNDNGTWIRFRWRTDSGDEERIADDDASAMGRDYLLDDLSERLAGGP